MGLIEKISSNSLGCSSILHKDEWGVVKINYSEDYNLYNSKHLYVNQNCGLAITLLKGRAILVTENLDSASCSISTVTMATGSSYYINENLGYTIIMNYGCELFSVESPEEQPLKVEKRMFTKIEIDFLNKAVNKEFNK
ncbi:hypothetical protein [Maribacter sp. Hel_I_7]|uniref:hypothetical protein n=1 Tax=Maribacter sp. Hel_I_7 TaxID=1249997 RepID=UPI000479AC68|nr:hypothetical protein [Maribacter sp. Hel_I_7]